MKSFGVGSWILLVLSSIISNTIADLNGVTRVSRQQRQLGEGPGGEECCLSLLLCDCSACLTACMRNSTLNTPHDYPSLEDGKDMYPSRDISILSKDDEKLPAECGYSKSLVNRLLTSIEKEVVNFYERGVDQIRMRSDGGYGLRMLAGQLEDIRHSGKAANLHHFFKMLALKSMDLGRIIQSQAIEAITDRSTKEGSKLILEKSKLLHPKSNFTWQPTEKIQSLVDDFDKEIIGREIEVVYPYLDFHCRIAVVAECEVPFVCKKMYLEETYSQYMLLHQAMYLQYAEKSGCMEKHPEIFKDSEQLLDRICAKAYLEAEYLERSGFPTRYIDLFAEQVGFCGLAGYPNFAREDWLREIMSWQSEGDSGCFIDHYKDTRTTDAVVTVDSLKDGEMVKEDCLVHLSSVGLMALAVNLRRAVDTCPEDYFNDFVPQYMNSEKRSFGDFI